MTLAIVTGGSRGIGAATARLLATAGHSVDILYRRQEDTAIEVVSQIVEHGGEARAIQCDVADESAVASYVQLLESEAAEVAVLVNNAAVIDDALIVNTSLMSWQQIIDTNLTGPFLMTKAIVPLMMDRRGGVIVNISSNSAHIPGPGQAAYAASKGGLESLTRACAVELKRAKIRVCGVRPGRVRTDMADRAADQLDAMGSQPWGEPEDVAQVVAFLASEAASYLNGEIITVDGGLSVSRPQVYRQ